MNQVDLAGATAVVTGGCGAIGSAVIARLRDAGANVLCVDLAGTTPPVGVASLPCDLGDREDLGRLCDELAQSSARILVHCAGITRDAVLWKMTDDDWDRVLRVNLDSAFWLMRAVVPRMRAAGGGSVVLVASINGERGKFGQTNYAASKAGLIALAKSAAREVGRFGIRVNAVSPGFIETPMTADLDDAVRVAAVAETATGRPGSPDDVARSVLFLCTESSAHVTGQVLRVDGGQLMA